MHIIDVAHRVCKDVLKKFVCSFAGSFSLGGVICGIKDRDGNCLHAWTSGVSVSRVDGTDVEESNSHVSRAHCDTPGIGDQDITPTKLLALLEQELKPEFHQVKVAVCKRIVRPS